MPVAPLGDQYWQTMDEASYGGKIVFLQIASGTIWWPNLQPMLIAFHIGQIWNQCWWRHLVVKFWTNTSGTALTKFVTYASGILFSWRDNSSWKSQYPGSVVPLAMFCFLLGSGRRVHRLQMEEALKQTLFFLLSLCFLYIFLWLQQDSQGSQATK